MRSREAATDVTRTRRRRSRWRTPLIALLVLSVVGVIVVGTVGRSPAMQGPPGFVYRDGAQLMLDGAPYRFVGVNDYDLTGCHTGVPASEADADAFFAQLSPNSMTRVWAFEPWGVDGLARTVRLAEKYGQKLTLVFADAGGNCSEPRYDAAWYEAGFRDGYFAWVQRVTSMFKDSPAVAIWEIMNEPGSDTGGLTAAVMKDFYDATAAHIKETDPNHLVSTGALAPWQSFQEGVDGYRDAHSGPDIDLVSVHEYDYPYTNGKSVGSAQFDVAVQAAQQLGKPIYVGETGIGLSDGCMTAEQRADVLREKFDTYLGGGASGVLYWVVLGPPNNPGVACDGRLGNQDPMVGGAVMNMIGSYRP